MSCNRLIPIESNFLWTARSFLPNRRSIFRRLSRENERTLSALVSCSSSPTTQKVASLVASFEAVLAECVFDGYGFVIIQLPWTSQRMQALLVPAVKLLAESACEVIHQDTERNTVVFVHDVGGHLSTGARYHETNSASGLHTDGPQLLHPPQLLFTACLRPAKKGGDTLLASAVTVHERLRERYPDEFEVLHRDFYFDRRGFSDDSSRVIEAPVFSCTPENISFRYLHEYVIAGHRIAGIPLSGEQKGALGVLHALTYQQNLSMKIKLLPGDLLIVNNQRVCHGRTAFTDQDGASSRRKLVRIWGNSLRNTILT